MHDPKNPKDRAALHLDKLADCGEGDTQLLAAITADGGAPSPRFDPSWDYRRPMDEEGRPLLPLEDEDDEGPESQESDTGQ